MSHTKTIKNLIVVGGPTGSGKTDLAIKIAQKFGAPILSADSRQFYRGMAIGTAQPDPAQLAAAEHHFIACREVDDDYTCGDYERDALALLDGIFTTRDTAVAVGGSGLYINALCEGMDDLPDADPELRARMEEQWHAGGSGQILARLQQLDPEFYDKVDRANPRRVIRALEVCIKSGAPYSTLRNAAPKERPFRTMKLAPDMPREELYGRIDRRVEGMMAAGLEAEARALYPRRALNALQTVGYRELFDHFDGSTTLTEAVESIKRNTRRYAKRQMTWFGRDPRMQWFAADRPQDALDAVEAFILSETKN